MLTPVQRQDLLEIPANSPKGTDELSKEDASFESALLSMSPPVQSLGVNAFPVGPSGLPEDGDGLRGRLGKVLGEDSQQKLPTSELGQRSEAPRPPLPDPIASRLKGEQSRESKVLPVGFESWAKPVKGNATGSGEVASLAVSSEPGAAPAGAEVGGKSNSESNEVARSSAKTDILGRMLPSFVQRPSAPGSVEDFRLTRSQVLGSERPDQTVQSPVMGLASRPLGHSSIQLESPSEIIAPGGDANPNRVDTRRENRVDHRVENRLENRLENRVEERAHLPVNAIEDLDLQAPISPLAPKAQSRVNPLFAQDFLEARASLMQEPKNQAPKVGRSLERGQIFSPESTEVEGLDLLDRGPAPRPKLAGSGKVEAAPGMIPSEPAALKKQGKVEFGVSQLDSIKRGPVDVRKPEAKEQRKVQLEGPSLQTLGLAAESGSKTPKVELAQTAIEMKGGVAQGGAGTQRLDTESVNTLGMHLRKIGDLGGGEVRIRLKPEHLGALQIRVTSDGNSIGLQIHASDSNSKQIIEESIGALKDSLKAHHLELASSQIAVGDGALGVSGLTNQGGMGFDTPSNDSRTPENSGHGLFGGENGWRDFGAQSGAYQERNQRSPSSFLEEEGHSGLSKVKVGAFRPNPQVARSGRLDVRV